MQWRRLEKREIYNEGYIWIRNKKEADIKILEADEKIKILQSEIDTLSNTICDYSSIDVIRNELNQKREEIDTILKEETLANDLDMTYKDALKEYLEDELLQESINKTRKRSPNKIAFAITLLFSLDFFFFFLD